MPLLRFSCTSVFTALLLAAATFAAMPTASPKAPPTQNAAPATQNLELKTPNSVSTKPAKSPLVGERIPSEDPLIKDFHSLGLIDGHTNIFRCASPTRDLVKDLPIPDDTAPLQKLADQRMQHLKTLGIRTIISLENPDSTESGDGKAQQTLWMSLEKTAAQTAGIALISHPLINAGPGSMETMSDADVQKLLDPIATDILAQAKSGGILFHCAAGHDRTGILAAYIRIKFQQWPADQAIDEMRRLGHNWVKYSTAATQPAATQNAAAISSWHEDHLKALADLLKKSTK